MNIGQRAQAFLPNFHCQRELELLQFEVYPEFDFESFQHLLEDKYFWGISNVIVPSTMVQRTLCLWSKQLLTKIPLKIRWRNQVVRLQLLAEVLSHQPFWEWFVLGYPPSSCLKLVFIFGPTWSEKKKQHNHVHFGLGDRAGDPAKWLFPHWSSCWPFSFRPQGVRNLYLFLIRTFWLYPNLPSNSLC